MYGDYNGDSKRNIQSPSRQQGVNTDASSNDQEDVGSSVTSSVSMQQQMAQHRMYEAALPEIGDIVIVRIDSLEQEIGARVSLLEYGNMPAMIFFSEASRRRVRSVQKLLRVGRTEAMTVLRLNADKGYVDLSKRELKANEVAEATARYHRARKLHGILGHVAEQCSIGLDELYQLVGWPLYRLAAASEGRYPFPEDLLMLLAAQHEQHGHEQHHDGGDGSPQKMLLDDIVALMPSGEVRQALIAITRHRYKSPPVKVRAEMDVKCYFDPAGVEAVKQALMAAKKCVEESKLPVEAKIVVVSSPRYVMTLQFRDQGSNPVPKDAPALLALARAACQAAEKFMETAYPGRGEVVIQVAPKFVGISEDQQLELALKRASQEGKLVAGDDDDEENGNHEHFSDDVVHRQEEQEEVTVEDGPND